MQTLTSNQTPQTSSNDDVSLYAKNQAWKLFFKDGSHPIQTYYLTDVNRL